MMTVTGWCPSCTCGWHKELDAFDVTPPEATCRNPQCACHRTFWQSVDQETARFEDGTWTMDDLHESLKRYAYGDR